MCSCEKVTPSFSRGDFGKKLSIELSAGEFAALYGGNSEE